MLCSALLTIAACCWLTLVCCEWVEISQHHYRPRKPYTNTSILEHTWKQPPNRRIDITTVDHTSPNTRFSDVTPQVNFKNFENKTWNQPHNKRKDVITVDNPIHSTRLADVTAVVNPGQNTRVSEVTPAMNFKDFVNRRVTETPKLHHYDISVESDYTSENTRLYDVTPTTNFKQDFREEKVTEIPKSHVNEMGRIHGKVEKVPNVGSIKRVQLLNTPIKSPNIKVHNVPYRRFGNEDNSDRNAPVESEFSDEFEIKSDIFKDSYEEVVSNAENNNHNKIKMKPSSSDFIEDNDRNNPSYPNFNKNVTRKFKQEINTTKLFKTEQKEQLNSSDPFIEKVTKNPDKIATDTLPITKANKINDQVNIKNVKIEETTANNYKYPDDDNASEKTNEFKMTTMENLVKFMQVVTDTITKNTRRNINDKVKYLNELKENLMQNIKHRIDTCWPDDSVRRRRTRATTSRGHVEFPSSESALMTISFLTFAVFLIKLVLQVIQTYKNKAMIMAPVMVATAGRAFARKQDKH